MEINQPNSLDPSQTDSLQLQTAQLEALYEPPSVPFTFETVGWEIVGLLLVLILVVAAAFWVRRYIRNRYRREALKQLKQYQAGSWQVEQVYLVLKQSAIHAYGRTTAGKLYGSDWLKFLEDSGKDVQLLKYEPELSAAIYRNQSLSSETARNFLENAKTWIITHAGKS